MYRPDTTAEAEEVYDRKVRALSQEERFLRGVSLTHFCRQVCLAAIQERNPMLTSSEIKMELFERIYGAFFSAVEKGRIRDLLEGFSFR